jgi:hypothetical protein
LKAPVKCIGGNYKQHRQLLNVSVPFSQISKVTKAKLMVCELEG